MWTPYLCYVYTFNFLLLGYAYVLGYTVIVSTWKFAM
jgi:hypothetical protein